MDNHDESLEFDATFRSNVGRPTFLLVICILSWVSVGWNVFGAVGQLTKSQDEMETEVKTAIYEVKKAVEEANGEMDWMLDQSVDFLNAGIEYNSIHNYGYLFLFLLQGIAVYLMFQQKKIGFWSYLGIQLGILAIMVIYYPWPNFMSLAAVGYRGFTTVLFTVLFAVNLKHMTK